MAQRWFFNIDGDQIVLTARAEDGDVGSGDSINRIGPDIEISRPKGLTYQALAAVGSGVLDIADDGSFTISASLQQRD